MKKPQSSPGQGQPFEVHSVDAGYQGGDEQYCGVAGELFHHDVELVGTAGR